MPGSLYSLVCPECSARHQISTGADLSREHNEPWAYRQFICTSCQTLRSMPDPDLWNESSGCPECGVELTPWAGRVWLDRDDQGHVGSEHVVGPCPRCGAELTLEHAEEFGLWD